MAFYPAKARFSGSGSTTWTIAGKIFTINMPLGN
jgi:hypothetical protein